MITQTPEAPLGHTDDQPNLSEIYPQWAFHPLADVYRPFRNILSVGITSDGINMSYKINTRAKNPNCTTCLHQSNFKEHVFAIF